MDVGLRIDVDTFRGTRDGMPRLMHTLDRHGIRASIFFSVGPDNMGRHAWRLLRPKFLGKMLRSDAASLYGWQILFAGTAWPGRQIGKRLGRVIRECDRAGHEVGLHAWDHHAWQIRVGSWEAARIERDIQQGMQCLQEILGHPVTCSATAGWRTTQAVIDTKQRFDFFYNSDCRGTGLFRPVLSSGRLGVPQIPVTLPTYDEVVGRETTAERYNDYILSRLKPDGLNVYTVHAEVEGGVMADSFDDLLGRATALGARFRPLRDLLPPDPDQLPAGRVLAEELAGREGWLGVQKACA